MISANHGDGIETLAARIAALLAGPMQPQKPFSTRAHTYAAVYGKARALHQALRELPDPDRPVLLCTASRALTAAALLAAVGETPPLVVPYALTPRAMEEAQGALPLQGIITDRPGETPVNLSRVADSPSSAVDRPLVPGPADRTMVYLFTGGSTGRPQIWPKTACNLFGEAFLLQAHFGIAAHDRLLATVVPYHIYGLLFSVLVPLAAGARVIPGVPTFPQEIVRRLQAGQATALVSVPLHYRTLNGLDFQAPHLKQAFSSAGRLEPEDGEAFSRRTGVGVTEIYGSTETGGIAARNRARDETALSPLPGVAWEIRSGRLHVHSPFISPGLATDARGFFRTGDRAAAHAGNGFVLQGRADGIVKVGGKRVDLDAVAEALKRLDGVGDAVVIPRPGRKGRETDILAVVESADDPAVLRRRLAGDVAAYTLPRRILVVPLIPVTNAGKYDRGAIEQLFDLPGAADSENGE